MLSAPKSFRLHIALFGRRNVGKSSLLNAITRQQVSIVSEFAGTTTDPVEKPMELLPLGPVLFIDTAGIDDVGALGELRVKKTRQVFERADLGVLVAEAGVWGDFERRVLEELAQREIPAVVVFNKADLAAPPPALLDVLTDRGVRWVRTVAVEGHGAQAGESNAGILAFRQALLESAPEEFLNSPTILGDLVGPGEMAVLVVPIDKEAPKGRLIMPQVQSIRDLLDSDAFCMVVKDRELRHALSRLKAPPKLVVTDSQAFLKVAADTPPEVPLTSFSILFARFRGDLVAQVEGTMAIDRLRAGDRVLVAEACSHHPIAEDIGRVKIPRWLTQYVGGKLDFVTVQGHDFPEDLASYKLVIHCGACVSNRREMLSRIMRCRQAGVPITNYGLTIAYSLGIFERALEPFPAALDVYRRAQRSPHPAVCQPVAAAAPADDL
jgi:[FeFe] hydrogenase H-cluster maturation GTPase HydF